MIQFLRSWLRQKKNTVVIGYRWPHQLWPIKLNLHSFNSHLYVVGASGQGKSKFLQAVLYQLATNSTWGCGLLDPHADLAKDLLAQLAAYPREKPFLRDPVNLKRVVYIDPSRDDYLPPLNILRNSFATPYETAENVVEAFRRVWPETLSEAPRFMQILRNALLAGKPVAIMGAGGGMGTSRAQYHLRQVCVFLDLHPLNKPEVFVNAFAGGFDADGNLTDEKIAANIAQQLAALAMWARRLKGLPQ